MRSIFACVALPLLLAAARADIAPIPDRGPFTLEVAGLDFSIQPVSVKYPPGYTKTYQVAVLSGCADGHPNCTLAKQSHLIGMEVQSVNGASLNEQSRLGTIRDAFAHTRGLVELELYRRDGGESLTLGFARR